MDDYYDDFLEQSVIHDEIEEVDDCDVNSDDDTSITSYKNDGFEMPSLINNDSNHDNQSSLSLYKNDFFELFESDENSMLLLGNPIDDLMEIKDLDGIMAGKSSTPLKPLKTTKKKHCLPTCGMSSEIHKANTDKHLPTKKIISSTNTTKDKYPKNNPESFIKKPIHEHNNNIYNNRSTTISNHKNSNELENKNIDIHKQPSTKPIVVHHHAPGLLHKQLAIAMNQVSMYRKENEMLQQKLDVIGINEAIMKYKALLIEKENKISDLLSENLALKEISRYQAKYLENEKYKSNEPEKYILTQENQIEILMVHIKKLKEKLANMKTNQDQITIEIELLKKRNNRLIYSNNKLRRKNKQLISNSNTIGEPSIDDKEIMKHKINGQELHSDSIINTKTNYSSTPTVRTMNMKNMKNLENIQNQIISNETIENILMKEEIKLLNKKLKDLSKRYNEEIHEFKIKLEVMNEEKESFRQKLYQSEENILKIREEFYNMMEQNKKSFKENKQRFVKRDSMHGYGNGRTYPTVLAINTSSSSTNNNNISDKHEDNIHDNTLNNVINDIRNNNSNSSNSINNVTTATTNGNNSTVISTNPQPPPTPTKKTIRSVRGTIYNIKIT